MSEARAVAALKQAEREIELLRRVEINYDWLVDAVRKCAKKWAGNYPGINAADPPEQMYALADVIDEMQAELLELRSKAS